LIGGNTKQFRQTYFNIVARSLEFRGDS